MARVPETGAVAASPPRRLGKDVIREVRRRRRSAEVLHEGQTHRPVQEWSTK